jgi:endonuclease-3
MAIDPRRSAAKPCSPRLRAVAHGVARIHRIRPATDEERRLKRHIATIGLYNAKAKNLLATCRILVDRHGGEVPRTREALEALPGVGRKTANVVLNTAFGEPTIAVDTHIFRVANRTGLAPGKTVRAVEDKLVKVVPAEFAHDAHHWLILHGRYVCKARKPDCPHCVIRDLCAYRHKTIG